MADRGSIAIRRELAVCRINRVLSSLEGDDLKFDRASIPAKKPDLAHVIQLENAASAMETLARKAGITLAKDESKTNEAGGFQAAKFPYEQDAASAAAPADGDMNPGNHHDKNPTAERTPAQGGTKGADPTKPIVAPAGTPLDTTTAPPPDDDTDQSDEAKARRSHRAIEHRTTKK